jgi:hypothetical protein
MPRSGQERTLIREATILSMDPDVGDLEQGGGR